MNFGWRKKYQTLSQEAPQENQRDEICTNRRVDKKKDQVQALLWLLIGALLCSNFILAWEVDHLKKLHQRSISPYTGISRTKVNITQGYFAPEYNSMNQTEADQAWDAINTGHGVVAVDKSWAKQRGLLPSRDYKPDRSKSVYTVATYHPLHCLPYMRKLTKRFISGEITSEEDHEHLFHCLSIIREELMCTADDTLLHSSFDEHYNRLPVGYGQVRQCTNWEAIRDWTTANSACWLPPRDDPDGPHWGVNCRKTDGIIIHEEGSVWATSKDLPPYNHQIAQKA